METYDSNGRIIKGIPFQREDVKLDFKTMSRQLVRFEERLHNAVDIENYEEAAILRDKIITLKKKMVEED